MQPRSALILADDLCEYSRNLLHNTQPLDDSQADPGSAATAEFAASDSKANQKSKERQRKQALKAQQKKLV